MEKGAISDELERIEESAKYSGQTQFEQAKFWRGFGLVVGLPAAVLAAISGGTGLADAAARVPAGAEALAAAGLGAVLTAVGAAKRVSNAHASGNAYLSIQTDARQLRLIDLPTLDAEQARQHLAELTKRLADANAAADLPAFYAYWRGRGNIERGRQSYAVDATRAR
ncbi:MAG TPA: hypothetical protein DCQ30_10545 [Acidimicrobiaceae bacterium]|nr:hypothetical protein [Acidimicrobiaceae bacterium]